MKKLLLIAAVAMIAIVSCNKPEKEEENKIPEVKTCAENLVMHLGFDANEVPGTGITFAETKGDASTDAEGYIGKGWRNISGDNTVQAYTKYNLAAGNGLFSMESFTFTAWVKLPAGKPAKGGLISFNGTGVEAIWPSFIFIFDNSGTNEETGLEEQDFNGRIDFLSVDGKPAMWPNVRNAAYAAKNKWFQIARTYDAATGHWANYVDGVLMNEGDFLVDDKPVGAVKAAFASDCNAMYIGGWSCRIEKTGEQEWHNYFPGDIDEVRFYNKALSEAELLALRKEEVAIALL